MKTKLLTLSILFRIANLFSQTTDQELENKYYNYRDRLKKYFTQIGEKAGQSITAAQISYEAQRSDSFKIISGVLTHINHPRVYEGAMLFGDAMVDHGFYLAVLASEYKLMSLQNRKNTPEFVALCNEIYFAINAVEK